ncbi:DUF4136 domain-containing protein [Steroidobacter sp. S1-65]|uniref:DUF4136 domain-containing protein n=1 Tax=Steroidobacter gossypii TaxID=2805490 RepID=A0ABS1WSC5_9GAMM|nr:DUF4136 domain-containing protein [Steroidobacter gossypii]MBM0103887.1 DUF4136 domain-containing protein [Steroidobacter gossypii]
MTTAVRTAVALPGLVSVALLAGCTATAPSRVRVDMAEGGLPSCKTFEWLPTQQQPATLTEQRVKGAVLTELKKKGYSEAEKAECRVTYVLNVHERPKNKPSVGVGAGGGSGGIGGGIGVSLPIGKRNEQAGTFTIDVVDAAKNAQVWSGSIDATFEKAELNEDEVREVVTKVLEKYPDRASK